MAQYDEWIVYNAYQVEIVSITDVDGKAIEFKNAWAKPTKRSIAGSGHSSTTRIGSLHCSACCHAFATFYWSLVLVPTGKRCT